MSQSAALSLCLRPNNLLREPGFSVEEAQRKSMAWIFRDPRGKIKTEEQ